MIRSISRKAFLYLTPVWLYSILFLSGCKPDEEEYLIFPYSQWTVGIAGKDISWKYSEELEYNNSFIRQPDAADWESWRDEIRKYRGVVRSKAGNTEPFIQTRLMAGQTAKLHFDKFAYELKLKPGEKFSIDGSYHAECNFTIYIDYDLKGKGEELSYIVRKNINAADSIVLNASENRVSFSGEFRIPAFDSSAHSAVPVLRFFSSEEILSNLYIDGVSLSVKTNPERVDLLHRIYTLLSNQSAEKDFHIPEDLDWTHDNYLMGFAFIWDTDFWDPVKGEYTVDKFCEIREREFGGLQSVILWHSYPNIGIDERNQFDFFDAMPGGLDGLKKVVEDFHSNGVRVFLTYNPWDLDTRRPEQNDYRELARVYDYCGADGIFLDTWRSAAGVISVFSAEKFLREEIESYGRPVAFTTEIIPELKDIIGPNALTSSWGQEIHPYNKTDLSRIKWLMPEHKQYFIRRMEKDRVPILRHAWINGQGIQLWENIFGTMNLWKARDRYFLKKMNQIWSSYGRNYITDFWLPFRPTSNEQVLMSRWQTESGVISNLVNLSDSTESARIEVVKTDKHRYFDLWNGKELNTFTKEGKNYIEVEVDNFGCIVQAYKDFQKPEKLLAIMQGIHMPRNDEHSKELSIKDPLSRHYDHTSGYNLNAPLLEVSGEEKVFDVRHIWREGKCYPDQDAKDNHDLTIVRENGVQYIQHRHREKIEDFKIMPEVVTNAQFEKFLKETSYSPEFQDNFLKHWYGKECPVELKDEPVVYVSLEDARAFADWAGMSLPTEWEWQLAAEQTGEKFQFNKVFEWNESERYDGNNRFVTLRGGCNDWETTTSWWYFPGAPRGMKSGGRQAVNSHVKYFLMYPGMDRASTIGFRCIRK